MAYYATFWLTSHPCGIPSVPAKIIGSFHPPETPEANIMAAPRCMHVKQTTYGLYLKSSVYAFIAWSLYLGQYFLWIGHFSTRNIRAWSWKTVFSFIAHKQVCNRENSSQGVFWARFFQNFLIWAHSRRDRREWNCSALCVSHHKSTLCYHWPTPPKG